MATKSKSSKIARTSLEDLLLVWSQSPIWTVFTYTLGLLPLSLLWNLKNSFHIDWRNHLWMISYVGEYLRRHWAFPITLNTDHVSGMAYPVFYGYLFYPLAGVVSALTGGNFALRLICAFVFLLQLTQVRRTFQALTGNRFFAFAIAILASFAIYPITNLYNRGAIPEFVATSLLVSVVMMCLRLPYVSEGRDRTILIGRAGLVFTLAFGTHPITAILGSLMVGAVLAITFVRLESRSGVWKSFALVSALIVLAAAPWVYALARWSGSLYLNETTGKVMVFPQSIGRLAVRLAPLPTDPRIGTTEVAQLGTPYLDAQINLPLALIAGLLLIIAIRRRDENRFALYAAGAFMVASVVLVLMSVSQTFWNWIPPRLSFLQFGYRLITYVDICFLLAAAFLSPVLARQRFRLSYPLLAGLTLCLSLAALGLAVKLSHALAVRNLELMPGSELSRVNRDALLSLPDAFYGAKAYAIRKGTPPATTADSAASFPVGRGSSFGLLTPVVTNAPEGSLVRTNLQAFPFHHIAVNGIDAPLQTLRLTPGPPNADVNAIVRAGSPPSRLTYSLRPDPLWNVLRLLSLAIVGLWSVAACALRVQPLPRWREPLTAAWQANWYPPPPPQPSGTVWSRAAVHAALLFVLGCVLCAEYTAFLRSRSFGPEFPPFYDYTHAKDFNYLLRFYTSFTGGWYRPTQFYLPYWIADRFVSWLDPVPWHFLELLSLLLTAALVYALVLLLLPRRRRAAFAAAVYFTCVPSLFIPLYEVAGFDFLHVVFTIACVIAYIKAFRSGSLGWVLWTSASWLAFIVALTSKEITIITPFYLVFTSAILLWCCTAPGQRRRRALAEVARLVPFFALIPVYWSLHISKIPAGFGSSGDYRRVFDFERVIENAEKYPLWLSRIYTLTTDTLHQAAGVESWINDAFGWSLLATVVFICVQLWRRSTANRPYLLLALGWILIFIAVPVYSGGYTWHGNLALVGYSLLVGLAVDTLLRFLPRGWLRVAAASVLLLTVIGLTRIDASQWLVTSIHTPAYRLNEESLDNPPVPRSRVKGPALVYVEDRQNLGTWWYGVGHLFNMIYENQALRQLEVPPMNQMPQAMRDRWLREPVAFYFRYDDQFRWHDATAEFRAFAENNRSTNPVSAPDIVMLHPPSTKAGVAFNPQPGGFSALSITGTGFTPQSKIIFGSTTLPTAFGSSTLISAAIPHELYATPNHIPVQVQNPDGGTSPKAQFEIK